MLAEIEPLLDILDHYFREIRKLVGGLSTEQLNWKPLQGETQSEATNSLYATTLHISFVAIRIAAGAADKAPPDFPEMHQGNNGLEAIGTAPDRAIEMLNEAQLFVHDSAENLTEEQLAEVKQRRYGEPKSVRWMMLHILDHTALHVGHMELLHQLVSKEEEELS